MKNVVLLIMFTAMAVAGARPIGWAEQSQRLVTGQTSFNSPYCNSQAVVVSLKVVIGKKGEVKKVSLNKDSRVQRAKKKVQEFAVNLAHGWTFKPVKVGNSFVDVETRPRLTCYPSHQ